MALSITVNGGGTFSASMEEGPVSFTASLGAVPGPKGDTGPAGANGVGVPVGGTTGQVLGKASGTNYDTAWISNNPFNQTLNTTDGVQFGSLTVGPVTAEGDITFNGSFGVEFGDATSQTTALPNGTADGNIVAWDAATSTYLSVPNDSRTLFITARNITGTTIPKGSVVLITGASGNRPTIGLAQGDTSANADGVIGITDTAIDNNANGRVITEGQADNLDTSAFAAGDKLYLSSTTPGGLVNVRPVQPAHSVAVGIVTRSSATVGRIEVRVQVGEHLEFLHDVLLTSKTNNDLLAYESSSGLWKNKSFSTLGLALSSDLSAYLTTSAAASTYAPLASPTFTGTVTIPAGASISGFAPLASPALTGNPTAPTQAAGNNSTRIATTAFVQQEVPAASTTTAGKVELATDAETVTGTSSTLAVTPFGLSMARLNPSFISFVATDASSLTSGGTSLVSSQAIRVFTGTANGSYGGRVFEGSVSVGSFTNLTITVTNFSKPIWLSGKVLVSSSSETSAYQQRFTYGKRGSSPGGGDIGDLAVRGFGIRCNGGGNAVVLQVHNGTTLTNVTSSFTPTPGSFFDAEIYSDGAGNVTLYVNGSSVATSSAGPTGNSTAIVPTVYVESVAIAAVTTTANTGFVVGAIKLDLNSAA